jgi:hypothetical protein
MSKTSLKPELLGDHAAIVAGAAATVLEPV